LLERSITTTVSAIRSTTMADAEFDDPERMELLKALKTALRDDVPPTAWACLWLSDIDRLRHLADDAQTNSYYVMASFESMETKAKIVQKCVFTTDLLFA
jgi:hypothetical protein